MQVQILQQQHDFACDKLHQTGRDPNFLTNIIFSDEATFQVSGAVNRHNIRIWGSEQVCSIIEHTQNSPKAEVWCGVMCNTIIGPSFFVEKNVTGSSHLDILQTPFLSWDACSQMSFFNKMELHTTSGQTCAKL
jgi:hypothetical protein